MKRAISVFKWFLIVTLIGMGIGALLLIMILLRSPKLHALEDAKPTGYRTTVYDDAGETMLTLSAEGSNRVYVTSDQIPQSLKDAVVSIEDERFYTHHGIDVKGIARAVGKGITHGGITEGASTITQQLIKNNIFTNWTEEDSFADRLTRKVQEWFLAMKLERETDKEWILENYLNTINLGGGNWGVETASRYYFGKDVSELDVSESAVLASVIKNPTKYNPLLNPTKNAERRELVLSHMVEGGYISEEEKTEALSDDIYTRIAEISASDRGTQILDYFEDDMIREVLHDLMEQTGRTEEEAWNLIYKGGLNITSTKNANLQKICEKAVSEDALSGTSGEIAIVMMDPATGQVKAMVGGRGEKNASLTLNRASTSKRQPGSSIKILGEYAAALESNSVTLATTFEDSPYAYSNGTKIVNANGKYAGNLTVNQAIAQSNNIVALKCFQKEGMDKVWEQIRKFGITTLTESDKVEALALGGTSGGVTDLEMTAAYNAIAAGGMYRAPITYTKVTDRDGNVILENTQESHLAISEDTSALLTNALRSVMASGTGTNAWFDSMPVAGKSGTTSEKKDSWFVGFSPYYTCGVWGGNDDATPLSNTAYVQKVWKSVMKQASSGKDYRKFDYGDLTLVDICGKCGKCAISGLCDQTVDGDTVESLYFIPGTEPTENCTCHEAVTICSESHQEATMYCPNKTTKVYLKEAVAGTSEETYVCPLSGSGQKCQTHAHFWSDWFGGDEENQGDSYEGSDSNQNQGLSNDGYDGRNNGQNSGQNGGRDSEIGNPYRDEDGWDVWRQEQDSQDQGNWWNSFLGR